MKRIALAFEDLFVPCVYTGRERTDKYEARPLAPACDVDARYVSPSAPKWRELE